MDLVKEGIIIKNAILLEITEDQVVSRLSKEEYVLNVKEFIISN